MGKSSKAKALLLTMTIPIVLTSCSEEDIDGNKKRSGLVIRNHGHKEESRTKENTRDRLQEMADKMNREKLDGLFSVTGRNQVEREMTIDSFGAPLTEEEMNKLGHMPKKYVGKDKDELKQYPYPDELGSILATMMPLTHEPIDIKETNRVSSDWGPRRHPLLGRARTHKGIDMSTTPKTPDQYAVWPGTITHVGYIGATPSSGYGKAVFIKHGNDFVTRYAHLSEYGTNPETGQRWKVGDKVKPGDVIGKTGTTGGSTGNHLHFEIHFKGNPRDPYEWLKDLPGWESLTRNGSADEYKKPPGEIEWPEGQKPFTMQDLLDAQRQNAGRTGKIANGVPMALPTEDRATYTYMNYSAVTSKSSYQFKLLNNGNFSADEEGFWRYKGKDYTIAMGTYYGTIGDRFQIELVNGTTFTAIMGDQKADKHTTDKHRRHAIDGSIVEFLMDEKQAIPQSMRNERGLAVPKKSKNLNLNSKIKTIIKLGSVPESEFNATSPVWKYK